MTRAIDANLRRSQDFWEAHCAAMLTEHLRASRGVVPISTSGRRQSRPLADVRLFVYLPASWRNSCSASPHATSARTPTPSP